MAAVKSLALALLLAACADGHAPTDEEVGRSLPGTAWRIAEMHGHVLSDERQRCPVTLTFGMNRSFGGTGIVNDYGSHFRVVGGLVRPEGIVQNMAAAVDEDINRRERELFAVLSQPFALRPTANGADLVDAAGQTQLRLARYKGVRCAQGQ